MSLQKWDRMDELDKKTAVTVGGATRTMATNVPALVEITKCARATAREN